MANFGVVVDSDPSRREVTRRALRQRIALYSHLEVQEAALGDVVLVWAVAPGAPGRIIRRENDIILVLGHVVGDRADAEPDLNVVEDGFHIVIGISRTGVVQVRPDLLGIFPVYFTTLPTGGFMVASSPYLFHAHPDFRTALELRAIVGLLYANTAVGGRSIYRGVKRLGSGRSLRYHHSQGGRVDEVPVFQIPISDRLHYVAGAACVDAVADSLADATRRHLEAAGGAPVTLMLSGGYDSRILAGVLASVGQKFRAVTLAQPGDVEAQCAARVARALGVDHRLIDQPVAPEWFTVTLRWDALITSPGTGGMWSMIDTYRGFGPWVVSGYVMDAIVSHYEKYDPVRRSSDFEAGFYLMNRSGFRHEVLARLLRPDRFGDALREVHQEMVEEFVGTGDRDSDRSYRFPLHHRLRYHTGAPLWKQTLGTWPVAPFLDRSVLETVGACPLTLLAERHLEQRLLRTRFPKLASLPLDRNAFRTLSLDPRLRELVMTEIRERSVALLTRLSGGRWHRKERRQYHRSHNFNGPVWRWIRRSMEPHRDLAYQLFDRTTFDQLVPPAEAEWKGANSIEPAAGVKSLLGIIGWLREFSPELPRA